MVQYSSSELLLVSLCGAGGAPQTSSSSADAHVGTLLVEVVASVLDNEVNILQGCRILIGMGVETESIGFYKSPLAVSVQN